MGKEYNKPILPSNSFFIINNLNPCSSSPMWLIAKGNEWKYVHSMGVSYEER